MSVTATHRQAPTVDAWTNFVHDGVTYDLSHLNARTVTFKRSRADLPEEIYAVQLTFAHHCFTKGLPSLDAPYDHTLRYDYLEDERIFDTRRWRLSHQLPDLIRSLENRKCLQTGKGNFLSVNLIDEQGVNVKYEIYFRTWKPAADAFTSTLKVRTSRPTGHHSARRWR